MQDLEFLQLCQPSDNLASSHSGMFPAQPRPTESHPDKQPTSHLLPLWCCLPRLPARTLLAAKCNVDTCPSRTRQKPPNLFQQATKELSDGNFLWRLLGLDGNQWPQGRKALFLSLSVSHVPCCAPFSHMCYIYLLALCRRNRREKTGSDGLLKALILAPDIVGFHIQVSLCSSVQPRQKSSALPRSPVGLASKAVQAAVKRYPKGHCVLLVLEHRIFSKEICCPKNARFYRQLLLQLASILATTFLMWSLAAVAGLFQK